MKLFVFVALALNMNLASAGQKDVVVGKDWVVTVQNTAGSLEIHQYFPDDKTIEVEVHCTFPDGKVTARTTTSAVVTDTQIINNQVATEKVYSRTGTYWCMAVVAKRVLNYTVLAEDKISITGDGFIPDGSILVGTPKN